MSTSRFETRSMALSLGAAAVLLAASVALEPNLSNNATEHLVDLHTAGPQAGASSALFLLGQAPNLIAIIAIGWLLRPHSAKLANWGTVLGVVGAMGEAAMAAVSLVFLEMANDTQHRDVYAVFYKHVITSPLGIISLVGLVGSVLGLLLLSIGLFRAGVGPRWIGPSLWAFLLLQYVGTGLSLWAGYLSVLLSGAAYLALARTIRVSSETTDAPPHPLTTVGA
jgi:hypothetical protein